MQHDLRSWWRACTDSGIRKTESRCGRNLSSIHLSWRQRRAYRIWRGGSKGNCRQAWCGSRFHRIWLGFPSCRNRQWTSWYSYQCSKYHTWAWREIRFRRTIFLHHTADRSSQGQWWYRRYGFPGWQKSSKHCYNRLPWYSGRRRCISCTDQHSWRSGFPDWIRTCRLHNL